VRPLGAVMEPIVSVNRAEALVRITVESMNGYDLRCLSKITRCNYSPFMKNIIIVILVAMIAIPLVYLLFPKYYFIELDSASNVTRCNTITGQCEIMRVRLQK
jgi:hypothetical protein